MAANTALEEALAASHAARAEAETALGAARYAPAEEYKLPDKFDDMGQTEKGLWGSEATFTKWA